MWDKLDDEIDNELSVEDENLDEIVISPLKRTRKSKERKDTEHYVSKEEMWLELYNYYLSLKEHYDWNSQKLIKGPDTFPKITDRLTMIIYDIATKMGYRGNFCTYSWLDEMIGDATLKMVKAIRDCSFKCFTIAEIYKIEELDNGAIIHFIDKKGLYQKKDKEESDEFFTENNKNYIKFKANPFGYFSRITTHSYLNRIKKEKTLEETKRAFQTETWEKLYANENFRNVRRPKYVDSDENEAIFEE